MPQDDQINYNVKVRLDPNLQAEDKSVIYDFSAKKFALGDALSTFAITNPGNNRVITSDDDAGIAYGNNYLRWINASTPGTTNGRLILGQNSNTPPQQFLTLIGDTLFNPIPQILISKVFINSAVNGAFVRLGTYSTAIIGNTYRPAHVLGFSNKYSLHIGTFLDETSAELERVAMTVSDSGRVGVGSGAFNPSSIFDVTDSAISSANITFPLVKFHNENTNTPTPQNPYIIQENRTSYLFNSGQFQTPLKFIQFTRLLGDGTVQELASLATINGSSVGLITASDRRLKENIKDLSIGLDELLKIQPREYRWKEGKSKDKGFIAQELYEIYPEAVTKPLTEDSTKDYWAVDYSKLTPLLVKAIQDQQKNIDRLEKKINNLEKQIK